MTRASHRALAEALHEARRSGVPIEPITSSDPSLTLEDAYAVQQELTRLLLHDGGEIVGYKLGLTSKPMQDLLGVSEPDFGPVLSTTTQHGEAVIDIGGLIQPRIEAEVALVLAEDLDNPAVTDDQVARAVTGARAAVEIIDSRIKDWKIGLIDTVADLASSAAVVLGEDLVPVQGWEPRLCGMAIYRNDELQATGAGAAALGDPLAAVAWLARTLGGLGGTLRAGHVVMTGSLHAAFPIEAGDVVRADFDRLGSVMVRIGAGAT